MKTGFKQKSIADALFETNYQSKIASELWLNIAGKDFRLIGKSIRIGRALDNDIVLEDRSSSRYHAVLTISGNKVKLEDLKSRNGIKVNGKSVTRVQLAEEDTIEIGDLKGVFFTRTKTKSSKSKEDSQENTATGARLSQPEPHTQSLLERWKSLPPKAKLGSVAAVPILLLALSLLMPTKESAPLSSQVSASATFLNEADIVEAALNRQVFEKCTEFEDLGNFRQSRRCFQALPRTREVHDSLARVIDRQAKLAERRFIEGKRAFDNYYYDLAIIKWQEVILISEDNSDFKQKAEEGIRSARDKKRLL